MMAQALKLLPPIHRCEIHVHGTGERRSYRVICDLCRYVGMTKTMPTAENVARVHEGFVAPLLKAWRLPS